MSVKEFLANYGKVERRYNSPQLKGFIVMFEIINPHLYQMKVKKTGDDTKNLFTKISSAFQIENTVEFLKSNNIL